jgi:hypothetical protein
MTERKFLCARQLLRDVCVDGSYLGQRSFLWRHGVGMLLGKLARKAFVKESGEKRANMLTNSSKCLEIGREWRIEMQQHQVERIKAFR